jgi:hypothetical protein
MTDFRYEVHDEDGCLRRFYTRKDAWHFMKDDPELKLVVKPKRNMFKEMLDKVGDCLF